MLCYMCTKNGEFLSISESNMSTRAHQFGYRLVKAWPNRGFHCLTISLPWGKHSKRCEQPMVFPTKMIYKWWVFRIYVSLQEGTCPKFQKDVPEFFCSQMSGICSSDLGCYVHGTIKDCRRLYQTLRHDDVFFNIPPAFNGLA